MSNEEKSKNKFSFNTLGINMAVGMAIFASLGYWIDQKKGGGQIWTLIGIFLGLFYCGYEVWKLIKSQDERKNDK